jgi:hypothetical protein
VRTKLRRRELRGEKETTATCSRKMSVRANRSVASSIRVSFVPDAGSFWFLRGEQAQTRIRKM